MGESRNWSAVAVRGCLAIAFGIAALAWPKLTLAVLIVPFAVYAIADGIFSIISASRQGKGNGWLVVEGVFSILVGLAIFVVPAAVTKVAFIFIGVWAFVTGALELLGVTRYRRQSGSEILPTASGVIRLLLGILLVMRPNAGLMSLIWLLALYAFAEGLVLLGLAFRMKRPLSPRPV